jgi:glycosyltransferase involved in cell wall biosynthesis
MTATSDIPHVLMIAPGPFFVDRGFGVSVYEQARALQRRGARVEVVCYQSGRDVPDVRAHRAWPLPGYDASRIGPSLTRLPLWVLLLVKTWLVARRTKPDVLHGHLHEGALIASIVSRLTGVPWIFDFQGSLSLEMAEKRALRQGSLPFRLVSRLEGWIDRRAPRILVRSGAMQLDLTQRFGVGAERIVRVMDGADPNVFSPRPRDDALRAKLGLPDSATVIGYIGLLTEQQGIERLLRAAQIVAGAHAECHFLIMGYPIDAAQRLARTLGIEARVTFTGRVDYAAAPDYLALADIAVAPKVSRTEGNGKLYNYAGMALPVVAIDSEVNREVLGDDAYYSSGESPEEFAHAIEAALADRAGWAERGRRLRARLEAEFTWDAVAARLVEAYGSIIDPLMDKDSR